MNIEKPAKFILAKENVINANHLMNVDYMKKMDWGHDHNDDPEAVHTWLNFTMQTGDRLSLNYGSNAGRCYADLQRIIDFIKNDEPHLTLENSV